MDLRSSRSFRMGDRTVFPLQGIIQGPEGTTRVQPKVMSVLLCLAQHSGDVVPRDEIVRTVWGKLVVSDESLTRCISELRQSLGDNPHNPKFLQTIPKIGYRLVEPIAAISAVQSLAVMSFESLGSSEADESFCDGLSEEILNSLSNIKGLRVAARTSAFSFKGKDLDIPTIGKALNVDAILEGSVRRVREKTIQISARLINVEDGFQVWSESFNRDLGDIFEIQEEIARSVADALKVSLLDQPPESLVKKSTNNVNAYSQYLRGRSRWHKRSYDDLMQSIAYYEQAIEEDPYFATAYSALAESWILLAIWGYVALEKPVARAQEAAAEALKLDRNLPGTYAALAAIAHYWEWDWSKADELFQKALALDPGYSNARNWYSVHLADQGRIEESLEQLSVALDNDPLNIQVNGQVCYTHLMAHDYDAAYEAIQRTLEIEPNYIPALFYEAWTQQLMGDTEACIAGFLKVAQPLPVFRQILAAGYAAAGQDAAALKILAELAETRSRGQFYVPAYFTAAIYVNLGDYESAFEWLDTAVEERSVQLPRITQDPNLIPLHDDPRFLHLLKTLGRHQAWLGRPG